MTKEMMDEASRLTSAHGLAFTIALSIIRGWSELEIEIERAQERSEVDAWNETLNYQPGMLKPEWDLDPSHFYLSLDGAPRGSFAKDYPNVLLMQVDVAELISKLQYGSGRSETLIDQWKKRSKTRMLGYRWSLGRPVTPPFLTSYEGKQIVIRGGMHRMHLAAAEGASTIPAIVQVSDLPTVAKILPSARLIAAASSV